MTNGILNTNKSIVAKETIELELIKFKDFSVLQRVIKRKNRIKKSYIHISAMEFVGKMWKELFNSIVKTINHLRNEQKI